MHTRADQKRHQRRRPLAQPPTTPTALVGEPQEEGVYGSVPVARELVPRGAVPPGVVEAAVLEAGEFRQEVEHAFPDYIPGEEVFEHKGEEEVREGPREFGQAG